MNCIEIISNRQNPVAANKAVDLKPERDKCDEINRAQESQEDRAGVLIRCRLGGFSNEQHVELIESVAMIGHEPVETFGEERKPREKFIKPKQPAVMADQPEHAEDRAGARADGAVRLDEVNRALA